MKNRQFLVPLAAVLMTLTQTLALPNARAHDAQRVESPARPDEMQPVVIVAAAAPPDERSNTQVPLAGIGSLYWAARHLGQAWRILLPIQSGDGTDVSAEIEARCALFATSAADQSTLSLRSEAACRDARGYSVR